MVGLSEDIQSKATEMMKKILTVGVGAFFLTEESLRGLISDIKLPKEILSGILESANKTKTEFLRNLSQEVLSQILEKINPAELAQEILNKNEIEIKFNLKFKPKVKSTAHKI